MARYRRRRGPGNCELRIDNANQVGEAWAQSMNFGQNGNEHSSGLQAANLAMSGIDENVPVGNHEWELYCDETNGDVLLFNGTITAVRLEP